MNSGFNKMDIAEGSTESTALLTAFARAYADVLWPELDFHDPVAKRACQEIPQTMHWANFNRTIMRGCVERATLYDEVIAEFIRASKSPVRIIDVGCGLDDRRGRMPKDTTNRTDVSWSFFDLPDIVELRNNIGIGQRHENQARNIADSTWLESLAGSNTLSIVVSEGLSYHLSRTQLAGYLNGISRSCPIGSVVVLDYMSPLMKQWHPGNKSVDGGLESSFRNARELFTLSGGLRYKDTDFSLQEGSTINKLLSRTLRFNPIRPLRTDLYGVAIGEVIS